MARVELSGDERIVAIREKVEALLTERLSVLHEEALVLSADMEALIGRLVYKGHVAKVDDLKAGRWYRTASDLRLLQEIYSFICQLTGMKESVLFAIPAVDDIEGRVQSKQDEDEVTEGVSKTPAPDIGPGVNASRKT
jgi:hypothetical protein